MTKLLTMLFFLFIVAVLFYGAHRLAPEVPPSFAETEQVLSVNFLELVDGLNTAELDFGFVNGFVAGKRSYAAIVGSAPPKSRIGRRNPFSTIQTPFEDSFSARSRTGVSPGPSAIVEDSLPDASVSERVPVSRVPSDFEDLVSSIPEAVEESEVSDESAVSEEIETPFVPASPEPLVR